MTVFIVIVAVLGLLAIFGGLVYVHLTLLYGHGSRAGLRVLVRGRRPGPQIGQTPVPRTPGRDRRARDQLKADGLRCPAPGRFLASRALTRP